MKTFTDTRDKEVWLFDLAVSVDDKINKEKHLARNMNKDGVACHGISKKNHNPFRLLFSQLKLYFGYKTQQKEIARCYPVYEE